LLGGVVRGIFDADGDCLVAAPRDQERDPGESGDERAVDRALLAAGPAGVSGTLRDANGLGPRELGKGDDDGRAAPVPFPASASSGTPAKELPSRPAIARRADDAV